MILKHLKFEECIVEMQINEFEVTERAEAIHTRKYQEGCFKPGQS
jgi:hypothetical protein